MSMSERDDRMAGEEQLLAELRAAMFERDPSQDEMIRAAKEAFAWRGVDEQVEMLLLSFDSLASDQTLVRGPSAEAARVLVFDSENATLELEVTTDVLIGQAVPGDRQRISVEGRHGRIDETETDGSGYFLLRRPRENPVRFVLHSTPRLVTDWTIL
jgi:hypothetical protein